MLCGFWEIEMADLTDEEVIDAMHGASRRTTYVVANILRMTHKHHNGTLGTAKVLRRLKALEKRGVVERARSDYAVQICWRLTPPTPTAPTSGWSGR